ncbi:hypothetical protein Plav_0921 [Parvibaculum lavamentivorans DS-1]|uniref:Cell wall hydrolase SleB domain-containing protein n=1 Tax=Parvibaculum lavamentivorans (strain DS-1 / DSM 13023 / NCIMB 13966) TaxID=402881 RepID=A7HRL1_PARL1|nr:hypothetical protein [Parvibaculum lavamentivorans]ABS62544.1 hypothetical protein Plav_0921 [Parvibaculum lavamentivorans DS-1]
MGRASDLFDGTPTLAEMAEIANEVSQLVGDDESEESRVAFAWMLLNRRAAREQFDGGKRPANFADADFLLSLAALCRAWAGAVPDPTRGATQFHPHTELPGWARQSSPRALIGGNFFYAP